MDKRQAIPEEKRVAMVSAMLLEGLTVRQAAKRFGVSRQTAARSYNQISPRLDTEFQGNRRERSQEQLTRDVYDTVADTLYGLRAIARETSKPEWIAQQSADSLARLVEAQWNQAARFVASFRPVMPQASLSSGDDDREGGAEEGDQAPGAGSLTGRGAAAIPATSGARGSGRNGTVDPAG